MGDALRSCDPGKLSSATSEAPSVPLVAHFRHDARDSNPPQALSLEGSLLCHLPKPSRGDCQPYTYQDRCTELHHPAKLRRVCTPSTIPQARS